MFDINRELFKAHHPCQNPQGRQFCNCAGACREEKQEESKPLENSELYRNSEIIAMKMIEHLEKRIKDLEQENKRLTENNHVMRVRLSKVDMAGSCQ
jgi:hypothetical protein